MGIMKYECLLGLTEERQPWILQENGDIMRLLGVCSSLIKTGEDTDLYIDLQIIFVDIQDSIQRERMTLMMRKHMSHNLMTILNTISFSPMTFLKLL